MAVGAGLVAELCYVHLQGFNRNRVDIEALVGQFPGKIMIVYFGFLFGFCSLAHCETIQRGRFYYLRFFLNYPVPFGSSQDFLPRPLCFPVPFLEGTVFFQRVVHLDRMDEFYAGRH